MKTYDFYDMAGRHLDTVTTDDPQQAASEISHFTGVDADEVEVVESQPCIDCGEAPTSQLFGLWWCDECVPKGKPPKLGDNAYYELIFKPAMQRVLYARKLGLDSVKAAALAEMKGDDNVSKSS